MEAAAGFLWANCVTLAFGNRDKRSSSMNVCSIRCCFDLPLLWPPLVPLWRGSTSPYSVYFDCTLNVHAKESLDFFEKQQILVQINPTYSSENNLSGTKF